MIAALLAAAARAERGSRAAAIAAAMAAGVAGVALVALAGWFLTGAALAGAAGAAAVAAFNYLLPSAAIRALAITRTLARYGERLLGHRYALRTLAALRPRLFARLAAAPVARIAARSGGDVAAHLGSDVEALEDLAIRRIAWAGALAGGLAGMAAAACAGWREAAILLAGLAASALALRRGAPRWLAEPQRAYGEALARLKALYTDFAGCSVELALYDQGARVADLLAAEAARLDAARLAIVRREAAVQGAVPACAAVTIALMLAATRAPVALQALAALGAAGAFEALGGLAHSFLQRARAEAALARLGAIAALPAREAAPPALAGAPELGFARAGEAVTVPPGGRIRVTGPSGAGKTRVVMTLAGLDQAPGVALTVDGRAPAELGIEALRTRFAAAPQDAPVLAGTVADNLRLARPGVDAAAMWEALAVACLADTVRALPAGLDTWLGPDGARLSGGQRRRLALARAVLAAKPWLILDEPSEGLDLKTEAALAARLDAWLRESGTGLVLVTHRPGLAWLAPRTFAV